MSVADEKASPAVTATPACRPEDSTTRAENPTTGTGGVVVRDNSGELGITEKVSEANKDEPLAPTDKFSAHQLFYIFALDGVGGMALSAGVNFALAYVMYTAQDTEKQPVRLFQMPNTLAGDAAVTIIVQCVLTWFVEWGLVAYDLSNHSVQPIGFVKEPSRPLLRWLFVLDERHLPQNKLASVGQQALRGFMLCVPAFLLLWPISVGALTAFGEKNGGDYDFDAKWTPQFFKFVLGGMLGLLTTPLMAMFWLLKAGWAAKKTAPPPSESA